MIGKGTRSWLTHAPRQPQGTCWGVDWVDRGKGRGCFCMSRQTRDLQCRRRAGEGGGAACRLRMGLQKSAFYWARDAACYVVARLCSWKHWHCTVTNQQAQGLQPSSCGRHLMADTSLCGSPGFPAPPPPSPAWFLHLSIHRRETARGALTCLPHWPVAALMHPATRTQAMTRALHASSLHLRH